MIGNFYVRHHTTNCRTDFWTKQCKLLKIWHLWGWHWLKFDGWPVVTWHSTLLYVENGWSDSIDFPCNCSKPYEFIDKILQIEPRTNYLSNLCPQPLSQPSDLILSSRSTSFDFEPHPYLLTLPTSSFMNRPFPKVQAPDFYPRPYRHLRDFDIYEKTHIKNPLLKNNLKVI